MEEDEPLGLGGAAHADPGNYIRHLFPSAHLVPVPLLLGSLIGRDGFSTCFDWRQEPGVVPQTLMFLSDLVRHIPGPSATVSGDLGFNRGSESTFWEVVPLVSA